MARQRTLTGRNPILPPGTKEFLHRRIIEGGGMALFLAAVGVMLALISFAPTDPSLNTASAAATSNLLGPVGAYLADFLLQAVGLGAIAPVLVLAAWGWLIMDKLRVRLAWLRLTALVGSMILLALGADGFAVPQSWPLHGDLGGVAGATLSARALDGMTVALPALADGGGWIGGAVSALGLLAGLAALAYALAFPTDYWRAIWAGLVITGRTIAAVPGQLNRLISRIKNARLTANERTIHPAWDGSESGDYDIETDPEAGQPAPTPKTRRKPTRASAARKLVQAAKPKPKPGKRALAARQITLDFGVEDGHQLPSLELLSDPPRSAGKAVNADGLAENARLLESVLDDFGVRGAIVKVRPGPVVTLYELEPAPGTKTSRVIGLADDIARSMSAVSVRVAVVPGRNAIGIELPNMTRETVFLRELLSAESFERTSGKLTLGLGKDIGGAPVMVDLARMPHLLIAGTTGSGKSVAVNTMILSLLYRMSPEHCKLIMIDPKMLELSVYDGIPHLLAPVVTDPGRAVVALKWAVREMENRYRNMSQMGVRNISGYNARLADARKKGEELTRSVQTGFDEAGKPIMEDQPLSMDPLPYIVVVVDEMADLMLVAGKDIEAAIQRLAQMARAAGIHLIMATQRPSVDVITGTIKANFPTRISFQVTSKIDSRTILGQQGAEQLLGQGDMLYMAGGGRISRVHGPFVSDEEVEAVVTQLKAQGQPSYLDAVTEEADDAPPILGMEPGGPAGGGTSDDAFYDQAVALIAREGKASTSFIQRHFQIGYNRAARIIERMEAEGVVSKASRTGKREVLVGHHGD